MASQACLELPPVSTEYTAVGRYEVIAGLNTYITGPEDATRGIIDIYDIFGNAPQTTQGADRLAAHTSALVLIPDFFNGPGVDPSLFPANTPERKDAVAKFRSEKAGYQTNVETLLRVRAAAGEKWPAIGEHWGVFGLCWGGKIAVLASGARNEGESKVFNVSGTAHPGALDAADAKAVTTPHICLASPGEPADVVAQYEEILSQPGKVGVVETYKTMFHGWMGARANLADEANAQEFERGYKQVSDFFLKHL